MKYMIPLALLFLILIAMAAGQRKKQYPANTVVALPTSSTPEPQDGDSPGKHLHLPVAASDQVVENVLEPDPSAQMYYLTLYNVRSVLLSDNLGNSVDPMFEHPTGGEIEGVSYNHPNRESVMLIMPTDKTYTVTFQSRGAEEIRVSIVKGFGNVSPNQAVRYNDLFLPAGVTAMLKITPRAIETLRVDADGDSTFETSVLPTVSLNGSAAADTQGPHISFSEVRQGKASVVTITATDPSGLRSLSYSLDAYSEAGMIFHPYTAPVVVNSTQTHAIYAVSEDQAGNSSGLALYKLKAASR